MTQPVDLVPVIAPSGERGLIPAEQLPEFVAGGGRIETPDEVAAREEAAQYGTLTEAAKHVVERGAAGLTMGLSDVAAAELGGDEYREARAARERQHGGLGLAAEAAGALAPLLASGGTGAAATGLRVAGAPVRGAAALGRVAETGAGAVLGRIGVTGESIAGRAFLRGTQLGAGGAVEGALYGAGHALSEAALAPGGDYDHLAERVWAGAKGGALFGALTGGAIGGLGGSLGAIGKRLSRGASVRELTAESAVQALDPSKRAARELVNTKRLHDVGQELLDRDIVKAFRGEEEMLARASKVRQEAGDEIGALLKMADDTGARPDAAQLFGRIDDVINKRGGVLSGKHRQVADQLAAEVAPLREAADLGTLTFEQLHRSRRAFDESINWAKAEQSAAHKDLIEIRRIIEDELEQNAERALARSGRSPRDRLMAGEVPDSELQYLRGNPKDDIALRKAYAGAKDPDAIATGATIPPGSRSPIPPIDIVIDSGEIHVRDGTHRLNRAREAGAKQIRANIIDAATGTSEVRNIPIPGAAQRASGGPFLGRYKAAKKAYGAARWAEKQLNDNLARGQANRMLGLSENIWGAGGLMAGGLTGSLGIGALTGLATTLGHKVVRTYGHGVVATLLDSVVKAEKRMNSSIRKFFRTAGDVRRGTIGEGSAELSERDNKMSRALKQRANETPVQAYQRKLKDLALYQADPVAYLQSKIGRAGAHMPQTTASLAGIVARGNAYLQRAAPGLPDERVMFGPSRVPNPDPVSLAKFSRKAQVVEDPMSVLDELEGRTLTLDHIDALKNVYPKLYVDLQSRVADEMAEMGAKGERLPYSDLVQVGTLLQIPTTPSMLPEHIAVMQAALKQAPSMAAPPKPAGGASTQNHMTKFERIESGGLDL